MSIITDYTSLQETIAQYAHRSDLDSVIPGFIQLAEQRMRTDLRVPQMQATSSISPISDVTPLPERFEGMRSVSGTHSGEVYRLGNVSPDTATDYTNLTGSPAFVYALVGTSIQIPQGTDQTFELDYWQFPEALATAPTNDVLTAYPLCYLYGSLIEVALYIQDPEMVAGATQTYQAARNMANENAAAVRYGAAPLMSIV
jgi:hypothetical protein